MAGLQGALIERPEAGDIIPGAGGIRKIRWGAKGKGKRGGVRVIIIGGHPDDIYTLRLPWVNRGKNCLAADRFGYSLPTPLAARPLMVNIRPSHHLQVELFSEVLCQWIDPDILDWEALLPCRAEFAASLVPFVTGTAALLLSFSPSLYYRPLKTAILDSLLFNYQKKPIGPCIISLEFLPYSSENTFERQSHPHHHAHHPRRSK